MSNEEIRVVIADDEPGMRMIMRKMIEKAGGFTLCGEADNGPDLLKLVEQYKPQVCFLDVEMPGMTGLDCLKAGEIIDIKFTKSYDTGKFFSSTQHPTYFELIPEARQFTYIASNGRDVWPETYFREDAPSIFPVISDFFDWLRAVDLMQVYQEKWATL